ncbi:MAG: amino acid ABC transporter substrate-binding protein [Proteobacteria bacterium]|nr:amino acid ABC transporter substrate-binding protein [Pseudomonadota bacterium]
MAHWLPLLLQARHHRRAWLAGAATVLAVAAGPGHAQDAQLSGTLAKVRASGSIALGFRESSVPFSFLSPRKEPIGYSVELCKALVGSIEDAVNKSLAIRWVPVTAASRIDAVESGQIDLECGSTTNNLERQKRVAFSPTIFVSGTRLMVKKGSPVRSFRDLAGKKVAVTAGTTNEKALRDLDARFKLGMNIVVSQEHSQSFELVARGEADAFATDDVLLYGLIAQRNAKADYVVLGDELSYDPYGIVYRKNDPQLAKVVKDALQILAEDGEIERQYKRWFLRKLPTGESIDLPMSAQLASIIEAMAVKPAE